MSGMSHYGKTLASTDYFFGCGNDGNKVRDFPDLDTEGREENQVHPCIVEGALRSKDRFFALNSKGDQE